MRDSRLIFAFLFFIVPWLYPRQLAAEEGSQSVEVFLHHSLAFALQGVTHVQVLDEDICNADVTRDAIQLFGAGRGSTVVFAWIGERRITIMVNVVLPPPPRAAPSSLSLLGNSDEGLGRGTIGSSTQVATSSQGEHIYSLLHRIDWTQRAGGRQLTMR